MPNKGNTKFWEILKIGWIVILYNVDIFGCPCGCIISTRNFSNLSLSLTHMVQPQTYCIEILAPKIFLLLRKIEYKNLLVLRVNFDKFQIALKAIQW